MAFVSFKPNPNLPDELNKEAEFLAGIGEAAEPAAKAAKNFAPVEEGDYRDSIRITVDEDGVRLDAYDYKAVWIEFGTGEPGSTEVFAPLRRGARAAGLTLKESDR